MAAPEPPPRPTDSLVSAPRSLVADSRLVLMAGVASACLLGAAAGAWVGPRDEDLKAREVARSAPKAATPMTPTPQMQIVMDANALPTRPPMEVLPDWARQTESPQPPPFIAPPPEPFISPPMRDAPSLRLVHDEEPPPPEPKAEKPKPPKVQVARAEEKPKPKTAEKPELAKAEKKPKADKAKSETKLAEADKARKASKKAEEAKLAKAEAAKRQAKAEEVLLAKAEKARKAAKPNAKPEKIVLAKAEPKAKKPAKAQEKPKPVVLAKTEPKLRATAPKPKSFDAMLAEIRLAEAKPAQQAPKAAPPAPKAEHPMKVAKVTAKAPRAAHQSSRVESPWADDDRRLARAYRRAAEAGVPEWRLERQQARWRQARDAAEREAPWAVRRVYAARIAELDDQAGEAAMEWN